MRTSILLLFIAGCAGPRMNVRDAVVADADTIEIDATADALAMGPWRARDVDRGWTAVHEQSFRSLHPGEATDSYAFVLEEGVARTLVACVETDRTDAIDVSGLARSRGRTVLACDVRDEEGRRIGELVLPTGRDAGEGFVIVGSKRLAIASAHELENGEETREAAGFEFRDGGRAIGALSVVDEKVLFIPRTVDHRTRESVAVAAAALCLAAG